MRLRLISDFLWGGLVGSYLVLLAGHINGCKATGQNAPIATEAVQGVVAAGQITGVNAQRTQPINSGRDTNVNGKTTKWLVGALVAIVALLVPSPVSAAAKWYGRRRKEAV